ncbi:MAG TPA: hypothetical protein PLL49_03515 [Bacteroidales bacterium]|nr:hypothetical protein [Bacteroidales bacterium]
MKINKLEDFTDKENCKENSHSIGTELTNNECNAISEMAFVGYFGDDNIKDSSSNQKFQVFVRGSETPIAHFHISDDETNGQKFHTCVCIEKAEYFRHTGKEGVLSSKDKQNLMAFLRAAPKNKRYQTHYEYICSMWNDNSSSQQHVNENADIPDYEKL